METEQQQPHYQITVNGAIDAGWTDWLGTLAIHTYPLENGACQTILTGPVPDQSALRGILNMLWDLNLELVAVRRIDHQDDQP